MSFPFRNNSILDDGIKISINKSGISYHSESHGMISEDLKEVLAIANDSLKYYSWCNIGFWIFLILGCAYPLFWIVSAICVVGRIWLTSKAVIDLKYSFEDDQHLEITKRMAPLQRILQSNKIWYISETNNVTDKKYAAGASKNVSRNVCKASTKIPFPFKTNSATVCFKLGKKTLVFLPDMIIALQGNKVSAMKYSEITTQVYNQRFIEREVVPNDAKIVDHTWQYVNKSGGPDKRFQNNKKLPICMYGEMEVRSTSGLIADIMFSNADIQ